MNKTYLIVGGASVASLAVGATGGYFFARKRLEDEFERRITAEVDNTKKYFSVLLMQAAMAKPDSPADLVSQEDGEACEEELTEADQRAIDKGRQSLAQAKRALIDYQGFAKKPPLSEVVESNIFTQDKKPPLPPRDEKGKFLPRSAVDVQREDSPEGMPYIITQEEFLLNDPDYEQEDLTYFSRENTLLDHGNKVVDNDMVGSDNLSYLTGIRINIGDDPPIICVRNEGLGMDYEVRLTHESLTEYMGFGESDEDVDRGDFDLETI